MARGITLAVTFLLLAASTARAERDGTRPEQDPATARRVFLVRHAQAWKNVPRSERPPGTSGDALDTLTPRGHEAAERIGKALSNAGVARILTSPARRARETAAGIASGLGLPDAPEVSEGLRPLDAGRDPRAADSLWRSRNWSAGRDPRPEGGESLADGLARAARLVDELAEGPTGGAVVLVTHGEIAAALLTRARGVPLLPGYFDAFPPEGSVHELAVGPDGAWRVLGTPRRP
jgi:broad specificity phosphatase PhoE